MLVRFLGVLLAGLLIATDAPANTTPQAQTAGETVVIPFDPPIGESLRYRWDLSEQKDGRTRMRWSIDSYRFEEAKDGYRLIVEPISYESNERDPANLEFSQ